jgi:hypothetical protein
MLGEYHATGNLLTPYNYLAMDLYSFSKSLLVYNPQNLIPPRSIADMNEEITAFIIKELSKQRGRRDIIQRVCERGGLHWREAERLIILIEARHRHSITTPQAPWVLFLSIGTLILGIGLLAFNLQIVLAFFQKDVLAQVLSLQSNSYQISGLLTGLGMTIGGLIGLWKAFGVIFPE